MEVAVVIVEQLDADGSLRSLRMKANGGEPLIVAFADEYEESRSGPFHFLNNRHEQEFQQGFAELNSRRVSRSRFVNREGLFHFETSWTGLPTVRGRLTYYALCLPEHAIPTRVEFADLRSDRQYRKVVTRDDQRQRFILYLECKSSHGTFDFSLQVDFLIDPVRFVNADFRDENTYKYGAHIDVFEHSLVQHDRFIVQQFFGKGSHMGDQFNVTGQAGAVGPNARAEGNTFNQVLQQAASNLDLPALAAELETLRHSMRKSATEIEHDEAIASIGAAEKAAKQQDGAGALKHLKSAGKWALDTATAIGTTVAAEAIQAAIGL